MPARLLPIPEQTACHCFHSCSYLHATCLQVVLARLLFLPGHAVPHRARLVGPAVLNKGAPRGAAVMRHPAGVSVWPFGLPWGSRGCSRCGSQQCGAAPAGHAQATQCNSSPACAVCTHAGATAALSPQHLCRVTRGPPKNLHCWFDWLAACHNIYLRPFIPIPAGVRGLHQEPVHLERHERTLGVQRARGAHGNPGGDAGGTAGQGPCLPGMRSCRR